MIYPGKCIWSGMFIVLIAACGIASQNSTVCCSDSFHIEGYYTFGGEKISKTKLEKRLRNLQCTEGIATRARNFRYGANGVGAAMWGVSVSVAAIRIKAIVDAVEDGAPITDPLGRSALPLLIGGELSSVINGLLRNHSDYLLYKATREYNRCQSSDSMVAHIQKLKNGWYQQGTLQMPEHVLIRVLKEYEEPRGYVNASQVLDGTGAVFSTVGAWFLYYGIMGFIESEGVDVPTRNVQLGIGIGLTCSNFFTSFISSWLRKKAIDEYNVAVKITNSETE